uniref:Photosystem I reaction center subunit XII n=1 Tax=Codium arabicum TaxID=221038 RepID=A0A386B0N9_CODAR|nr:photosystem I reaction center subunit M [Codium arabicum]AYC65266.1 photosystem I reaction center subunit M [Codium arabicum]
MIPDNQIYIAIFLSLINAFLALRLGNVLYNS